MFENETRDFENDTSTQPLNGLSQKALDVAPGILNTVKCAFDMLTNTVKQLVKFRWVLQGLVSPFGRPDAIASALADVGLPVVTQKALVAKDVAVTDMLQNDLSRCAFISMGGDQVIHHGQTIQRGQHDQFIA